MASSTSRKKPFCSAIFKSTIACNIHHSIQLPDPFKQLLGTGVILRLENVLQLGSVSRVYPGGRNMRFEHVVGVCHLAMRLTRRLKEVTQHYHDMDASYPVVTERDVLCLGIAGLFHDAGHGPFSHSYDKVQQKLSSSEDRTEEWIHEQMSAQLLDHDEVRAILDLWIDPVDYLFIKELIDLRPRKLNPDDSSVVLDVDYETARKHGTYAMGGRSYALSFLYDIVSNKIDGIDLDRVDYFLRDSYTTGVSIEFQRDVLTRMMDYVSVCEEELPGGSGMDFRMRLAYPDKMVDELTRFGNARSRLHRAVYQHKVVAYADHLVEKIMLALHKSSFRIAGSNGVQYRLCDAVHDFEAFLKMDDGLVLHAAEHYPPLPDATEEENAQLQRAKQLIEQFKKRKFFCAIESDTVSRKGKETKVPKDFRSRALKFFRDHSIWDVIQHEDNMEIIKSGMHHGSAVRNPLELVAFYNLDQTVSSSNVAVVPRCEPLDRVTATNSPADCMLECVRFYFHPSIYKMHKAKLEDAVCDWFDTIGVRVKAPSIRKRRSTAELQTTPNQIRRETREPIFEQLENVRAWDCPQETPRT